MLRFVALLATAAACFGAAPDQPLRTLKKDHPRLMAQPGDFTRLQQLIRSDAFAGSMYAALKVQADAILAQPPVVHRLIGPRLLDQSRRALDRVYALALVYRIEGGRKYLDRAVLEMRTAAAFPDWNPSHFLDTAEMTHALAIGYDWLYADLIAEDRAVIRRAIVEKGLDPGIAIYQENRWWVKSAFNWNQVCNGGMAIGALAVAEDEADRATYVVKRSIESMPLAMQSYAPEGGWAEGPGYWHYATRYNVYYLAALESALGSDFGLSQTPGFSQAGTFRIYFQGPSGMTFNYADAGASIERAEEMFWLARKFNQPAYAWDELTQLKARMRPHALDLLWYDSRGVSPQASGWPRDRMFPGVDVAFLRSAWDDPNALWFAIKGGDNKANHSHLDLGSFVLDAGGVRWAADLGGDDYNLPAYFGDQRWTYYRLRSESHNTVLIDGDNQNPKAPAPMTIRGGEVTIDLAKAYPGKISRWVRTARLADRVRLVLRDEIEASQPVEALWGITTAAELSVRGRRAELEKDRRNLLAEIVSPEGAVFEVASAAQAAPQNRNQGFQRLLVRLPGKVRNARIEVVFTPVQKGLPVMPENLRPTGRK